MTKQLSHLGGWGNYPRVDAPEYFPAQLEDCYTEPFQAYLPRGMGRSYGDASLPAPAHDSLNTRFLKNFISFDRETNILEAEGGVTFEEILHYFVPKGYFVPVTPGTKFVSLGGAIASNVHGKNHHHVGSIERFVKELTVRTPTGTFTCSPDQRPDLFRGTISGYGLTGLIERVKLEMRPIETSYFRSRNIKAQNLEELFALFVEHDQSAEYSVAWVDTLATGKNMGRAVLILGDHAKVHELNSRQGKDPLKLPKKFKFDVPFYAPSFLLNDFSLRCFNEVIYRVKGAQTSERIEDYDTFFYPLDSIHNWNRLYGKRGFLQYQFIIPDPHGVEGVTKCMRFLSDNRIGSFLSVLKRYDDDLAVIPFAKKGYSLTMDIPFRKDMLGLLDQLDKIVLEYGGRLYLSKDARLSGATFRQMYPKEHKEWQEVIATYNPNRTVWSAMADRLEL